MQEKNLITEGDAQLEDQQSFIEREISPQNIQESLIKEENEDEGP